MDTKKTNRIKNNLSLIGLFLFFLSPIFVSYYYLNFSKSSSTFKNNGDLITPARPLAEIELHDVYASEKKPLFGKWSLAFLNSGVCEKKCQENMYKIRQIRLAEGKHAHRVQRVVILDSITKDLYNTAFTEEYQGQLILSKEDVDQAFINTFKVKVDENPYSKNRIYIIDPLGNLMMSYESDADPYGIIEDLKVLIRASRIG